MMAEPTCMNGEEMILDGKEEKKRGGEKEKMEKRRGKEEGEKRRWKRGGRKGF